MTTQAQDAASADTTDDAAPRNVRPMALALADQVVTSAGNFLTVLLLARWLTPATFGEFVLGYSAILLLKNFHLALVTTPLMTIGGAMVGARFACYRSAMLRLHVICTLAALLLVGTGALLLSAIRPGGSWTILVLPVSAAVVALLWQEFVRRSLFAEQRRGAALANDIVRYGLQLALLVFCARSGVLSARTAFIVVAVGATAAGALGIPGLLPWRDADRPKRQRWLRETLDYGKWLAGHYTGVWVIERWYLVALAAMLTTTEVGVLAACATLLSASNVFYLSFENYAIPVFARRFAKDGPSSVRARFGWLLAAGSVPAVCCCALLALFADPLLELLYGAQYAGYGWFLGLAALQAFIGFFARFAAIGLKILRRSREVFWAYGGAAMLTIAVSGPLISKLGLAGAGIGLVIVQVALAAPLLFWLLARPLAGKVDLAALETGT